jgi:transcriptional regulator with XRE-family HTH domain
MPDERRHASATELGSFLRARRTQVSPAEAGLPRAAGVRRTPGLRREEVATLAGVSIDYYTRLERGSEAHPSPSVVDALARALMLGEAEVEHLRELTARAARSSSTPRPAPSRSIRPEVMLLLASLRPLPAFVLSRSLDVLACNPGGGQLFPGLDEWPASRRNIARYGFLHPAARTLFGDDWDHQIRGSVARLRALAGTDPDAADLASLAGELLVKSADFARLWERYEVGGHTAGRKTFHHPLVGDMDLCFQSMQLEGSPGHRLVTYLADPGTPEHDKLVLLDMAAGRESGPGSALDQTGSVTGGTTTADVASDPATHRSGY